MRVGPPTDLRFLSELWMDAFIFCWKSYRWSDCLRTDFFEDELFTLFLSLLILELSIERPRLTEANFGSSSSEVYSISVSTSMAIS